MEKEKILYFEGAGMGFYSDEDRENSDVGNHRIRTAFTNNEGKKIYLEMGKSPMYNQKRKIVTHYALWIDSIHYIDEHESRIKHDWQTLKTLYRYTKADITKVVNLLCNTDYSTIQVLPDLAGYRVHGDQGYNLIDDFDFNEPLTQKRLKIKQYFEDLEKSEGKKYPNFSIWADGKDPDKLHLLRHFNGYNKHWEIDPTADNWQETIKETKLGMYGC